MCLHFLRQTFFLVPALLAVQVRVFAEGPVAVVAALSGNASVSLPKAQKANVVHALDWLDAGVRVRVYPKSKMRLILLNGHTYELGGGAKATIGADTLSSINSQVRELTPLPPIPRLTPIADTRADVSGATRTRSGAPVRKPPPRIPTVSTMSNLYPHHVTAIASHVKLSFAPLADAANYDVVLRDERGIIVLRATTPLTSVDVPAEALQPGSRYSWSVRALGAGGALGEGKAEFVTISKDDLERRTVFAKATSPNDKAMQLALLADVDQQLGLLAEARDEFEAALELRPSDPTLQHALAVAKAALAAAGGK